MREETVNITRINIQIRLQSGPDIITFITDMPEGIWPFEPTGARMKMDVARGKGIEYIREYCPDIPVLVLDHGKPDPRWREL